MELNFLLLLLQPISKFSKTQISIWRIRILGLVQPLWEHSLTSLLGHDPTSNPGIALRQWVHFQGVHNILDLLSWDQEELKTIPAQ